MTNKIRAKIERKQLKEVIEQYVEISTVDEEDHEQFIYLIHVDEIEISADFIKYLYKEVENKV